MQALRGNGETSRFSGRQRGAHPRHDWRLMLDTAIAPECGP
jgi:hypothetical protein